MRDAAALELITAFLDSIKEKAEREGRGNG